MSAPRNEERWERWDHIGKVLGAWYVALLAAAATAYVVGHAVLVWMAVFGCKAP